MPRLLDSSPSGRRAPSLIRLAALAALVVFFWAASATPASAHAALDTITPPDGAVLQAPPAQLELVFNEKLLEASVKIAVTDDSGEVVIRDRSVVSGATVSVPWNPDLPGGTYTIAYRVVSGDGHPITGQSTFTLALPLATEPPTSGDAMPLTPAPSTPGSSKPTVEPTPRVTASPVAGSGDEPMSLTDWRMIGGILIGTAGGIGIVLWQRRRKA